MIGVDADRGTRHQDHEAASSFVVVFLLVPVRRKMARKTTNAGVIVATSIKRIDRTVRKPWLGSGTHPTGALSVDALRCPRGTFHTVLFRLREHRFLGIAISGCCLAVCQTGCLPGCHFVQ